MRLHRFSIALLFLVLLSWISGLSAVVPRQTPVPVQAPPVKNLQSAPGATAPCCGMTDCPCGCREGKPCECKAHRRAGWKWQRATAGEAGYWWKEKPARPASLILHDFTHTTGPTNLPVETTFYEYAPSFGSPSTGGFGVPSYGSYGAPTFATPSYAAPARRGFFRGASSGGGCGG